MSTVTIVKEQAPAPRKLDHAVTLADIEHPALRKGIDLWERACGGRRFPAKTAMTPRVLRSVLPHAALVQVLPDDEFVARIAGDAIQFANGFTFQGLTTAEVEVKLPGFGKVLHKMYATVRDSGEPLAMRGWFYREADTRCLFHETVNLPLGSVDGVVDHLLVLAAYELRDNHPST
jgi:hypothetical protein